MSSHAKKILRSVSKAVFWIGIAGLAVYLLLSLTFYATNTNHLHQLQSTAGAYNILYLVAFAIVSGLAGLYFFRPVGVEEERVDLSKVLLKKQAQTSSSYALEPTKNASIKPAKKNYARYKRKDYAPVVVIALLFCLIAVIGYNTLSKEKYYSEVSDNTDTLPLKRQSAPNRKTSGTNKSEELKEVAKPVTQIEQTPKDSVILPPAPNHQSARSSNQTNRNSSSELQYMLASKAYLYSAPEENTRRNAFIDNSHNSAATLLPLNDKNGFIYVVFTNPKGETVLGWLRKKDLTPVNAIVYNDSK